MQVQIKIRHRSPDPAPWKWELYVGKRLVTASNDSYATQSEAHTAGRAAVDQLILDGLASRKGGAE